MLKALFLVSTAMTAQAFLLSPSSSVSSASHRLPDVSARDGTSSWRASPLSLKAQQDPECRRKFMRNFAAAGMPLLLLDYSREAHAYNFDVKEGDKARQDYLEDVASMKKARWNRQPTRLDIERTLPKMAPVKGIMDQVRSALEKGDVANVATIIGDQSIEFTKRNSNLGVDIPELQVAKPYMYRYAQAFSGAKESALTKDIKDFLDAYFNAMTKTRESALSGDKEGTKASFQSAEDALKGLVEAVDKETLNGRLNSIKVSLGFLIGREQLGSVKVVEENMKEMRRREKEGVYPSGDPTKKFL
ncbi:hypothetical protein GUITHDRAFT_150316 [Guillardia theta CCMP2712]|uniref:Uncharacterized protein n=1 Tax=Guillardia theta (strain CCMP2712) TaxID=905079 RepID=L1K0G8_GUITC|nr:hypothetical protein GUITHDRAFT_150316 [Guillardia theta CCMP2712]EKX53853.1 hypothetical protein GUITHDRAFT_150316 [Guillardia theta CCMP2712]|eukprot:XP_005840833.1 hypothetical protein GUITHDRAFT_150316 [Guillardia theta CCMP2712]